ncbi:MAG: NAD(P)-binding domain-containing protein [Nitrososphaerota archaeon]
MAELLFDGDLSLLRDLTIAVIGYGNQGSVQAKILRENGLNVIVGNVRDEYWRRAESDGFKVYEIREAVRRADAALLLVPDEVAPEVYYSEIDEELRRKSFFILDFASGYNIAYGLIKPAPSADVVMVAPRMFAWGILERHRLGLGYPVLLGVAQNASGRAWDYALALAKGIGAIGLPGGVALKSSFEEEAFLDLLSEHTYIPLLIASIMAYFEVATKIYGASPEAAILELYASGELAEQAKAMAEEGLIEQLKHHSRTSQYGQLTRIRRYYDVIREIVESEADEIWSGEFAREFAEEKYSGMILMNRLKEIFGSSDLVKVERKLLKAIKEGKLD